MKGFIKFIVRNLPRVWLIRFGKVFCFFVAPFYKGNKFECPVCSGKFRKFLPYGNKGADNRLCPGCLSLERHRLLWLYLNNKTGFFKSDLSVLHVAPEQPFIKRFRKLRNLKYVTGDLESPLADVKMDICNIPFNRNYFDIIICNHVLEHITDEKKALSEIFRVLKPGGWAILQVPVDTSIIKTYEDETITSPRERELHFGQYDHVRVHGLDYSKRLEDAGFTVKKDEYLNEIDNNLRIRYRLPDEEIIYFSVKPE